MNKSAELAAYRFRAGSVSVGVSEIVSLVLPAPQVIGAQDVVFTVCCPGVVGECVGGCEWDWGGDQGGDGVGGAVDDGDCAGGF